MIGEFKLRLLRLLLLPLSLAGVLVLAAIALVVGALLGHYCW